MANSAFFLLLTAIVASVAVPHVWASDPDPIYDLPDNVTDAVYYKTRELLNMTQGLGGNISRANLETFPALKDQGISYSMFHLAPCGANVLHSHPRASELQYVIHGAILAGFVDTTGKVQENLVLQGEAVVYPRGLLHYQQNMFTEPAILLSALNSAHPGTLEATKMLELAETGVAASLGVSTTVIDNLRTAIRSVGDRGEGPGLGTAENGSCRNPCTEFTSCRECDAVGFCGWCSSSQTCLLGNVDGSVFAVNPCPPANWVFNVTACPTQ